VVHPLPTSSRRMENALLLLIVACAWLYTSRERQNGDGWFSRQPDGYYELLTAGFRDGHTYVRLQPPPGLLALPDPYDPVANAPYRAHDMSFWRGRYYLYFGVTPVLIFFWPVAAATGWYPTEPCAVAIFSLGGFLAAVALLRAIRHRHFPSAPLWSLGAGMLCLAWANPILMLTSAARFYEVPICCAFFLQMLLFGAVYRALHSARPWFWLVAASLCFGLAVGARPDYVLGAPLLPVLWIWLARRAQGGLPAWARLGLAAFGPAALCAAGLMTYNWLRFGSVLEFGWHYQLAGQSYIGAHAFGLRNLIPNAATFLLGPGLWQRYYPFFAAPPGDAYGMLRYLPWCWLALGIFLPPPLANGAGERRGFSCLVAAIFFTSAANLIILSTFFVTEDRYMADYVPGFLLLGGIGTLALAAHGARRPGRSRFIGSLVGGAAAVSVFVGLAVFLPSLPRPDLMLPVARWANWPAQLWDRAHGAQYGALQMELVLPVGRPGATEPIFETGASLDRRDWLQITYLEGQRAQLSFFHAGLGSVFGWPFAVPRDRRITLAARCGSLLPPYAHPFFAGWTPEAYEAASRDLQVSVNGAEVLRAELACHPLLTDSLRIGTRGWSGDGIADRFSGRIISWKRMPLTPPPAALPILHRRTPVELSVLFPADISRGREPLLLTGSGRQGDLLYCLYEGPGRARLALNHAYRGGPSGDAFSFDPARPCVVEIWMGSLAGQETPEIEPLPLSRRIVVRVNGVVTLNEEGSFNPADPETIRLGSNPGASSSAPRFNGLILGAAQATDFDRLPPPRPAGEYGAVDLQVLFPAHAVGALEPLVTTGVAGAGDIVYVRYEDASHLRFGLDHWGLVTPDGPLLRVDPGQPHRIEITMGSLYPAGGAGAWARRVRVKMDGATALDRELECYPSTLRQIEIGKNFIGGSFAGPAFSGNILRVVRVPKLSE